MRRERALPYEESQPEHASSVVVAVGLRGHQRAYVADGLGRSTQTRFVNTFDELDRVLPALVRCEAMVLAPVDSRGRDALATVERLAREWPDTAIVVFSPTRTEAAPSFRHFALAGAQQFVFEGMHNTAALLAQAVENARRECAADAVFRPLSALLPVSLQSIAQLVLGRPDTLTSVAAVASALGVHRKTLVNRCARDGFVQPGELIMWCRLAMVGHQLARTGSTVEAIALTYGFPSHTALRNALKRYTGCRATEIRSAGGVSVVLHALETRLRTLRPT